MCILLLLCATGYAADPELTNHKSGISLTWGIGDGSDKGVAYMEEYLYHDKMVSDRKIVYIRSDTRISMTHNQFNTLAVGPNGIYGQPIGKDGLDNVADNGDEGIIRFKVDRDLQVAHEWVEYSSKLELLPAYTAPLSFAQLTYQSGMPVVGSAGPSGTAGDSQYFWRGIQDDHGDEWHTIMVGDDDSKIMPNQKTEQQASDGKIFIFVVNPKTPALTVRATGGAQFFTTPPKAYFVPKIHAQTTYFSTLSGSISFELKDIMGGDVAIRINGGNWETARSHFIDGSRFNVGTNSLEYYSSNYPSIIKRRTVISEPAHPSREEDHGDFLWGSQQELQTVKARLSRDPYKYAWNQLRTNDDNTQLKSWDKYGVSPYRRPWFTLTPTPYSMHPSFRGPALVNAFAALVDGWSATPPGRAKTWGSYAKEMLLNNVWARVDPIGYEGNQASGANPCTEVIGAGYYMIGAIFDALPAYDIIAGHFRSDQVAGGLTAIEDYYIRDVLASASYLGFRGVVPGGGAQPGLWTTPRIIGATMVAMCLSNYATPYFGTSGYGGNKSGYAWTPSPDHALTWEKAFSTTKYHSSTIPGTNLAAFNPEEPALWRSGGVWGGPNIGYFNLSAYSLSILVNLNARYSVKTIYPEINAGLMHAVSGTLLSIAGGSPTYSRIPLVGNRTLGTLGAKSVEAMKARNEESDAMRGAGVLGLVWYDDSFQIVEGLPAQPSDLRVN